MKRSKLLFWTGFALFLFCGCASNIRGKSDPLPLLKETLKRKNTFFEVTSAGKHLGNVATSISQKGKEIAIRERFSLNSVKVHTETRLNKKTGRLISQTKKIEKGSRTWKIETRAIGIRGVVAIQGKNLERVALELPELVHENDTLPLLLEFLDFKKWEKSEKKSFSVVVLQPQLGQIVPVTLKLRGKRKDVYQVEFIVGKKKARASYEITAPHYLRDLSIGKFRFHRAELKGGSV